MKELIDKKIFTRNSYDYYLQGTRLVIYREDKRFFSLNLQPKVDGKSIKLTTVLTEENRYEYFSSDKNFCAIIGIENNEIYYSVTTKNNGPLDIKYFDRSVGDTNLMRTFAADYDNYITPFDNSTAEIKSRALPWDEDENIKLKTWFFTPQNRAVSVKLRTLREQQNPWFGVSVPGKIAVTRTKFHFTKLCCFEIEFKCCMVQNTQGECPRVYFYEDLECSERILEKHYDITFKNKEVCSKGRFFDWWSRPILTPCSDLITLVRGYKFNYKTINEFVTFIEGKTGIDNFNVAIDGYWFEKVGEYKEINSTIFESVEKLREFIDCLHLRNHKVLLWFSQFRNDKCDPASIIKSDYKNIFDYTNAYTRDYIKELLRFMISSEDGCLNADGIKLDFSFLLPDMEQLELEDTSWGFGDEYRGKVNEFLLDTIMNIKADAYISDTTAEPSTALEVVRLNDDWGETISSWLERGRKAVSVKHAIIDTDGYEMSQYKYEEYAFVAPVMGMPNFYCVHEYFGNEELENVDYKLLRASWNVYANAPVNLSMTYSLNPEKNIFERFYVDGPLKGFYAALLIDGVCLATYNKNKALLVSKKEGVFNIPIPTNYSIEAIIAVLEDKTREDVSYHLYSANNRTCVAFLMSSYRSNVCWYEVSYVLK